MPATLTRSCPHLGCGGVSPCPTHQPMRHTGRRSSVSQRVYDQHRGSSTERGYDSKWRKARLAYLSRHPLCRPCEAQGFIRLATIVDHIIPHKGDKRLFWDSENNWQPICQPCHDRKTWDEAHRQGTSGAITQDEQSKTKLFTFV